MYSSKYIHFDFTSNHSNLFKVIKKKSIGQDKTVLTLTSSSFIRYFFPGNVFVYSSLMKLIIIHLRRINCNYCRCINH